nr:hypothetical protein [Tanacetum cinerariifolium]
GSNPGSKRRRFGKELVSTSAPKEKTSKSTGSSKEGFKYKTRSTDKFAQVEEEVHTDKDLEEPAHQEIISQSNIRVDESSCKSLVELEYFLEEVCKASTDQLDWNNPEG